MAGGTETEGGDRCIVHFRKSCTPTATSRMRVPPLVHTHVNPASTRTSESTNPRSSTTKWSHVCTSVSNPKNNKTVCMLGNRDGQLTYFLPSEGRSPRDASPLPTPLSSPWPPCPETAALSTFASPPLVFPTEYPGFPSSPWCFCNLWSPSVATKALPFPAAFCSASMLTALPGITNTVRGRVRKYRGLLLVTALFRRNGTKVF